jgi:hypothetical protein
MLFNSRKSRRVEIAEDLTEEDIEEAKEEDMDEEEQ